MNIKSKHSNYDDKTLPKHNFARERTRIKRIRKKAI